VIHGQIENPAAKKPRRLGGDERRLPIFGIDEGAFEVPDDFNEMSEDEFDTWKEAGVFDGMSFEDFQRENAKVNQWTTR
jgi:hypothetical protein